MEKTRKIAIKRAFNQSHDLFADIRDFCAIGLSGPGGSDPERISAFMRLILTKCRTGVAVCDEALSQIGKGEPG